MALILFFFLALVCIGAVLGMIVSKNQAYNALFLILAFVATAGLFALLQAPFIATVQVIIYAGAIMVLFIFVIMMINIKEGLPEEKKKWTIYLALGLGVMLAAELIIALKGAFFSPAQAAQAESGSPSSLGRLLFSEYLYAFEITSILIISALVGAIVLVKKKEKE